MVYKLVHIHTTSNNLCNACSGQLSFFESLKDIPFEFKRFYYIYDVKKGEKRGFHAHKKLKQFIFCPHGKIELELEDYSGKEIVLLDNPNKGIFIDHPVWRVMEWKEDCSVLCVVASDYYSEDDYIRSYEDFVKYVKGN